MKLSRLLFKNIATLGPIGYLKASGSLASFMGLLLVFLSDLFLSKTYSLILILVITFLSYSVINYIISDFAHHDPSEIVLDEVVGIFYAFGGLNLTYNTAILGFILFRFFDITKIFGISYLEKAISNPLSIIIDDIAAGLFANLFIQIYLKLT